MARPSALHTAARQAVDRQRAHRRPANDRSQMLGSSPATAAGRSKPVSRAAAASADQPPVTAPVPGSRALPEQTHQSHSEFCILHFEFPAASAAARAAATSVARTYRRQESTASASQCLAPIVFPLYRAAAFA